MNPFRRLSIGQQAVLVFGTLCAILLTIGALFWIALRSIERTNQLEARALTILSSIDSTMRNIELVQANVLRQLLASDAGDVRRLDHAVRVLETANATDLDSFLRLTRTPRERRSLARIVGARAAYWAETEPVLALGLENRDAEATDLIITSQAPAYDEYLKTINDMSEDVEAEANEAARALTRFIARISILGDVLLGMTMLGCVGTGVGVAGVARRLKDDNRVLQLEVVDRQRAEAELRSSEARIRAIVESSLDCIVTIDRRGTILEFNPAAERVFGYRRDAVIGRELAEVLVPPSFREQHRQALIRDVATGDANVLGQRIEVVAMRSGGIEFPVELSITQVVGDGPPTYTGFIRDISDRKRAERGLNLQFAISRVLADSSTGREATPKILQVICEHFAWDVSQLWSVDSREDVVRCVDSWSAPGVSAETLIGVSRQTTLARGIGLPGRVWNGGRPSWIDDMALDGNAPRASAAALDRLRSAFAFPILVGSRVIGVIEVFSRDAREHDEGLLPTFAVLGSQLGQFFQRRRLEDQLLQSQKLETVGKLAGGVAHEFNSILTAIIGQSALLLGDLPAGSPLAVNVTEIRKAADRAADLTRQLLVYGRKAILHPEILDLNLVLAGMESTLRSVMGHEADLRIVPGPGLHAVKADAGQIEQLITNMAMNAADAMPNGGRLTLETGNVSMDPVLSTRFAEVKAGEYVQLAITDTGTGMSEEVRARVFEPFFSTKGVGEGTGLGLSTCYGIVKQSGGHLTVYSEPGRGTTFKIYLPMAEPPAAAKPAQRVPALPRGTETVLLVEDDPGLREMAASLLRRLGYTVLAAADGIEAVALAQQRRAGPIDALFADIVMPHMTGKELSERVRASHPHTRVLFTSAYTESAIDHQGLLNAGVALLQKPFTPAALAHKLREVLDRPGGGE